MSIMNVTKEVHRPHKLRRPRLSRWGHDAHPGHRHVIHFAGGERYATL